MFRQQPQELDLSITKDMKSAQLKERIQRANNFMRDPELTDIKIHIMTLCIRYANTSFTGFFAKDLTRYTIYSNIMRAAQDPQLNDLHFLAYVVRELSQIKSYDNSSLRKTVLPTASAQLKILLTPEIARTQKAFLGLAIGGMAMFLANPRATAFITPVALVAAYFSGEIVYARLYRSLDLMLNRNLIGNNNQPLAIEDGLQDEVGRLFNSAASMMDSGLTLFQRGANNMQRIAHLGSGQQQRPQVEVLPDNALGGHGSQPDRIEMPAENHARPGASAPPAHLVEDVVVQHHTNQRRFA